MAENKPDSRKPETQTVSQAPKTESKGRAAESGDPAVHQLLARRQTAEMNDNDAEIAEVDRQLADLGYTR
jgi:hypothetical protein